jgi:hypothetical protein
MKYMQVNLENFGGYDVEFPLLYLEHNCRIRDACILRSTDPEKFESDLKKSGEIVQMNIAYFSSDDFCEGPAWDEFREALVDMMCKLQIMTYEETCLLED